MWKERELLMDEGNAMVARLGRGGRVIWLRVQLHPASVGFGGARYDIHQGALTGSILPDERVDPARLELEIDAVERNGGTESLLDS